MFGGSTLVWSVQGVVTINARVRGLVVLSTDVEVPQLSVIGAGALDTTMVTLKTYVFGPLME